MNAQIEKSVSAKMSQSGKVGGKKGASGKNVSGKPVTKKQKPRKSVLRRALGIFLWLIFGLIILAAILLALAWHFRMDLAEGSLRKTMAKSGYDAEFTLKKLTKTQTIATDITVSKDEDMFFTAERMIVDYDFNKRTAQRIVLIKPDVTASFNIHGKVLSDWWPKSSPENTGSSQKLLMPPNGLEIKDAVVNWRLMSDTGSNMGSGQTDITADIMSLSSFTAHLSNAETQAQTIFNDTSLSGGFNYDVFVETKDGVGFDVFGALQAQGLATDLLPISPMQADKLESDFKLNIGLSKKGQMPGISGWLNADVNGLALTDYKAERANIKLKQIIYAPEKPTSANWDIDLTGAQISNPDMRIDLADKLTSHTLLANTPIAKYFTHTLYKKADHLLRGFDVEGQGSFQASGAGYEIDLFAPLNLEAERQSITFNTNMEAGFIRYDKTAAKISVASDINWSGDRALKVSNFSMVANSKSGTRLDGMHRLNADIRSTQIWRGRTEGLDLRLSPFDLKFSYAGQGNTKRILKMRGGLDYDGPVPGGSVLGLKADGDVRLNLRGKNFTMGYTPTAPLSIRTFNNASGWVAKSVSFTLQPEEKLLAKSGRTRPMQMVLTDVKAQIIGPENARHLATKFDRLDISTDFSKSPQHWNIKVKNTDITSDDFPAPGTQILTDNAVLDVYQTRSGNMTFNLHSPNTHVATDNAVIENLRIGLKGSPDDIALDYNAGSVTMVGGAVPVLPMYGTARLHAGELTGHAITNLPRTKDTPIDIHYRSLDGKGSAQILIPKIIFEPNGLQPQHLVPVLRGKLADVSGAVSAEFFFEFGAGAPVRSYGTTDLLNLNLGTLVGPISGVNSKLKFSSIFPLKTQGIQTATLAGFDPGFPLKDGTIRFEMVPDGVTVHQAIWPIANIGTDTDLDAAPPKNGSIFLTPMDWRFGDVENRVTVNVENVGLGAMLAGIGKDKLSATGQVSGTLPTRINGVNVLIDDGVLMVKDGGIIRYKSSSTDAAGDRNETVGHAFKALENFTYKQLEARIDGPIDGAMALKIVFDGNNPEVLSGQSFQFTTNVTGELANIARNMAGAFSNEENLSRIMEIRNGEGDSEP